MLPFSKLTSFWSLLARWQNFPILESIYISPDLLQADIYFVYENHILSVKVYDTIDITMQACMFIFLNMLKALQQNHNSTHTHRILHWHRYVHSTACICIGTLSQSLATDIRLTVFHITGISFKYRTVVEGPGVHPAAREQKCANIYLRFWCGFNNFVMQLVVSTMREC